MRSWMIAYVIGVVVFHWWGTLLPSTCSIIILIFSLAIFLFRSRVSWLAFFLISLVWSSVYSELNKRAAIDELYEGINLYASGYVCSIPKQSRSVISFELCDSSIRHKYQDDVVAEGLHLKLAWYTEKPTPLIGHQEFIVRIKRPHGMVNPNGFLYEKWLFRKGINAVGYVKRSVDEASSSVDGKRLDVTNDQASNNGCGDYNVGCSITAFRIDINNYLSSLANNLPNIPLIKALSLGYRGDIDSNSWALFKNTGTQHLVAISGLHIGLVFGIAMGVFTALWHIAKGVLPPSWVMTLATHKAYVSVILGLVCALGYAAMAGFLVSTQRALVMLLVYYACGLSRQHINANTRLLIAAVVVLVVDPNAVLDYGFWLSFLAVWVLFFITIRQVKQSSGKLAEWLKASVGMQWVIFVGLLPMLLASGIGVSYTALLANFIAIPLVGIIIVPIVLSGLIALPFSSGLSYFLMSLANGSLDLLFAFLEVFNEFTALNIIIDSTLTVVAISVSVLAIIILPIWNGVKVWLVFTLALFLWFKPTIDRNADTELAVLDVGQGLAVVATKGRDAIVYDVGPAYRNGSAAQRSLIPYLKAKGIEHIEMLVVSHGDDDHSGGLTDIEDEFTIGRLISGQPERLESLKDADLCEDGMSINGGWYDISFYYPPSFSVRTLTANNHSCVVKLSFNNRSVLLMGDVEKRAERLLVSRYGNDLKADILIAGHHGSKNATSTALLNQVRPEQVVFSAGYKSRFRHPHPDAVQRASGHGAEIFNTAQSGAIIIREVESEKWVTTPYREEINAFWLF